MSVLIDVELSILPDVALVYPGDDSFSDSTDINFLSTCLKRIRKSDQLTAAR